MTLDQLLTDAYRWADAHAALLAIGATTFPLAGAAAARVGKGGRTDRDGRLVASAVVGVALLGFLAEMAAVIAARALGKDVLQANVLLLLTPIACLAVSLITIRWVFPLRELGSVRQALDIGAFVVACWAVHWLFGRFHWGVVFFGGVVELLVILALGALLVERLYRRAFASPEAD